MEPETSPSRCLTGGLIRVATNDNLYGEEPPNRSGVVVPSTSTHLHIRGLEGRRDRADLGLPCETRHCLYKMLGNSDMETSRIRSLSATSICSQFLHTSLCLHPGSFHRSHNLHGCHGCHLVSCIKHARSTRYYRSCYKARATSHLRRTNYDGSENMFWSNSKTSKIPKATA